MYRTYRFRHDSEIFAEKSHEWSTHYLILKGRVVICQVPNEDIEQSRSWIKLFKDRATGEYYERHETKTLTKDDLSRR